MVLKRDRDCSGYPFAQAKDNSVKQEVGWCAEAAQIQAQTVLIVMKPTVKVYRSARI